MKQILCIFVADIWSIRRLQPEKIDQESKAVICASKNTVVLMRITMAA